MHTCREPFRRCTAEAWCAAQKRRASCKEAALRVPATEAVGTAGQGGASDPRRCCGEEVTGSARRPHDLHRATLCAHQSSENANCAGQTQILREGGSECRRVALLTGCTGPCITVGAGLFSNKIRYLYTHTRLPLYHHSSCNKLLNNNNNTPNLFVWSKQTRNMLGRTAPFMCGGSRPIYA